MAAISDKVSTPPQNGDGTNKAFAFDFSIVAPGDIGVYVDGVEKEYPADYSVAFGDVSGTVTFHDAPAAGTQILLVSRPDYRQTSEFADQGAYNLSTVNTINRRATIRGLVTEDKASRALKVPLGETPPELESLADAEGMVLGIVGGRMRGVANDTVAIASDVARAETAASQTGADRAATSEDRTAVADFAEEFADVRSAIAAGTIAALIETRIYATRMALAADLAPSDGLYALVVGDPTAGNNDLYKKNGATGAGSWSGPLGIFAAASAQAQSLRDQTEVLKTAAETAHDGAVASMMSLFDVAGTQTIGRFINPVDGTAASNNSYAWNDPVGASGRLSQFIIYAHAGGTLQLARYVKSGSTLTRVGLSSVVTIGSAGLKTLTAADYGTFSVNAGDYLAVYCNGVLAFNGATADGGGWFNFASGLPASGTAGTLVTSVRLEASFTVSILTQTVTATTFGNLLNTASTNAAAIGLLNAPATQPIGRPVNPVTGPAASTNSYVWNNQVSSAGNLIQFQINALATGTVQLGRYTKAGSVYTRVALSSVVTISSTGLKTFTPGDFGVFPVNPGDYLVCYASAGVLPYTVNPADGGGWFSLTSGAGGLPTSSTANVLTTSLRLEAGFTVSGTVQVVTADAFQDLQAAALGGHLLGKKFGVWGDSTSQVYSQIWQDAFVARTGAILWRQDARGGRTFASALEAYGCSIPAAGLGSISTYSNSAPLTGPLTSSGTVGQRNIYGQVPADGTSLAQWLSDLDFLIVWLGINDAAAIGSSATGYTGGVGALTDSYTANTQHGAMNFFFDALLTAKPDLRIIAVNNYRVTTSYAPLAIQQAVADATLANLKSRGIPMLNARETWGINTLSIGSVLRDGVHPTDEFFGRVVGPTIAQFVEQQM